MQQHKQQILCFVPAPKRRKSKNRTRIQHWKGARICKRIIPADASAYFSRHLPLGVLIFEKNKLGAPFLRRTNTREGAALNGFGVERGGRGPTWGWYCIKNICREGSGTKSWRLLEAAIWGGQRFHHRRHKGTLYVRLLVLWIFKVLLFVFFFIIFLQGVLFVGGGCRFLIVDRVSCGFVSFFDL